MYRSRLVREIFNCLLDEERDIPLTGILVKIAKASSLRYAMQLLCVGEVISGYKQHKEVEPMDLKRAHTLFHDRVHIIFLDESICDFVRLQLRTARMLDSWQEHMIGHSK